MLAMFTWWSARGKRYPLLLLAVVIVGLVGVASAEARTPTSAEWNQEAYREAKRQCFEFQRNSAVIDISGIRQIMCVTRGKWQPDAGPCFRKNLANHNAYCLASFVVKYNFGKMAGTFRLYVGRVHMHWVRNRPIRRRGRIVYVPVIAVERPVGWRAAGWIRGGRDPRD